MLARPLRSTLPLAPFALAPVVHFLLLRLVMFAQFVRVVFTRFVCPPFLRVVFTRFVVFTGLVSFPSLVLCGLARRHVAVAPPALLAVVPSRRTPVVVGDVLHILVMAPTVVIAIMSAPVVGKGAAAQQRNSQNSRAKKTPLHKASAQWYVQVVFRMRCVAQTAGSTALCVTGHARMAAGTSTFAAELLTRE